MKREKAGKWRQAQENMVTKPATGNKHFEVEGRLLMIGSTYRMVITTRYVHNSDVIYDVRKTIFCLFHKNCHMSRKNLVIKRQFIC